MSVSNPRNKLKEEQEDNFEEDIQEQVRKNTRHWEKTRQVKETQNNLTFVLLYMKESRGKLKQALRIFYCTLQY